MSPVIAPAVRVTVNYTMDFKTRFELWLSSSLEEEIPNSVQEFSFNLFEPAFEEGVKFGYPAATLKSACRRVAKPLHALSTADARR